MVPENVCDILWVVFVVLAPRSTPLIWKFLLCTWKSTIGGHKSTSFFVQSLGGCAFEFLTPLLMHLIGL